MTKWALIALAALALAAGCDGSSRPAATAEPASAAPAPAAPTATASPPPDVPVFLDLRMAPASSVVLTGQPLAVTAVSEAGGVQGDLSLAQVTVAFGDGSTQTVTASCAGQGSTSLTFSHVYQEAGRFVVQVTAAVFCDPAVSADLSGGEDGYPVVLASAPAGSASWPQCGQAQLQISGTLEASADAAGNRELLFTLRNDSAEDCQMYGYPGMLLASPDGTVLPTTVTRGGGYMFPAVSPLRAALAPGDVASFDVGYAAGMRPQSECDWATEAEIFVPGSSAYTPVSLASAGTGDDAVACGADFSISPVVPGGTGIGAAS